MRRTALLTVVVLTVPLATVAGPASAAHVDEGAFRTSAHAHSEFGSPGGADLLFDSRSLAYDLGEGDTFAYSSIPCDEPAPHNDTALVMKPHYPGVDSPDAVRHHVEGTVTELTELNGRRGTIEGTITTVHCEDGVETDEIVFDYQTRFKQSTNFLRFIAGTWDVAGGTGKFSGLEGEGSLQGGLTCLDLVLQRDAAGSCEELGAFSDAVLQLRGEWRNTTL